LQFVIVSDNPYDPPTIPSDPVDPTYRRFDATGCLAAGLMCLITAILFVAVCALAMLWS
jgi:hypothetical protein